MTDRRRHPAHLAVPPFRDRKAAATRSEHSCETEWEPAGQAGRARYPRARPEPDASGPSLSSTPCRSAIERRRIRHALDLDQVSLGVREPRVGEAVRQAAVLGQEQQALAIEVETSRRVDSLDRNQRRERGPP